MRLIEPPGPNDPAVRVTPAGRVVAALIAIVVLAALILGAMQGLRSGQSMAEVLGPIVFGALFTLAMVVRRRRQRR